MIKIELQETFKPIIFPFLVLKLSYSNKEEDVMYLLWSIKFFIFAIFNIQNISVLTIVYLERTFLFHNLFTFKTPKCKHELLHLHGNLWLTRRLLRGEAAAMLMLLDLTSVTKLVQMVEMCFPNHLKLPESLGEEWGGWNV